MLERTVIMVSIWNQERRTKTYVAGDWDGDRDAIDQLRKWNNSQYWGLNFVDVHEATFSNDDSLNCSIKYSLRTRMGVSKTFVLIVGEHTNTLRSGACYLCSMHVPYPSPYCINGHVFLDNRSYVEYECNLAKSAYEQGKIKIVVLYNSTVRHLDKCPSCLRGIGTHVPMKISMKDSDGMYKVYWNYLAVKAAMAN